MKASSSVCALAFAFSLSTAWPNSESEPGKESEGKTVKKAKQTAVEKKSAASTRKAKPVLISGSLLKQDVPLRPYATPTAYPVTILTQDEWSKRGAVTVKQALIRSGAVR